MKTKVKRIKARIQSQTDDHILVILDADYGHYDWRELKLMIPKRQFKSVYRTEPKPETKTLKKED